MTVGLVRSLRLLNTVLRLASHVSIIGMERCACLLIAHRCLTIRGRASISVSLTVGRLLLGIAALGVSRLVVVHLVAVVVVLVVAMGPTSLGWGATQPAGAVHGRDTTSAIAS